MKLYELTENFRNLQELLDNPEMPQEAIGEALEQAGLNIQEKLENICKLIRIMENDVAAHKEEEKRIVANRKVLENRIESLKQYSKSSLESLGENKIKAGTFTISLAKNPPKVNLTNEELITDNYFITQRKLDTQKLKDDLKDGMIIEGAELIQEKSLRIK